MASHDPILSRDRSRIYVYAGCDRLRDRIALPLANGRIGVAGPLSNRNISRSWHEWEIDGRERRLILVIETHVEMCPEAAGYDAALMEEVRSAAVALLRATPSAIDRIRIVPVQPVRDSDPSVAHSDAYSTETTDNLGERRSNEILQGGDIERNDLMEKYNIIHRSIDRYEYGRFRYSNLDDAIAQAERDRGSSFKL